MDPRKMSPQEFDAAARAYLKSFVQSRRGFLGGAASLGALALTGLPGIARAEGGSGVLRVGRADEPDSLDPQKTNLSISSATLAYIVEPMAKRDVDGNLGPGVAESWEFTNENKTLIFRLKPDMVFQDGTPLNAEAVAWSVRRHMDPATASPSKGMLGPLVDVEVLDDLTIAYNFENAFIPVFVGLSNPYTGPLSKAAVEKEGDAFGRAPVAAGPFKFESWSSDRGIRLARNELYGPIDEPPLIEAIEFIQYPEDTTRLAAFETGEINAMFNSGSVPVTAIGRLKDNPDAIVMERPSERCCTLMFNLNMAPLDDIRVRQAISHAIDTDVVVAFGIDGQAVPATSPVASAIPGYSPATKEMGYGYDPEKAKALLAEAGVELPLKLELLSKEEPITRRTCEVIQAQLAEVGVELSLGLTPVGDWIKRARAGEGDLNLMTYTFSDADIMFMCFHSTGSLNFVHQLPEGTDAKLELQRTLAVPAERQAVLDELQAMVIEDALWKPLYEPMSFGVVASDVHGAVMDARGAVRAEKITIS
ncbi:ABC transporter substrate-binding protein [Chachezhania sediminis]|uniref:ABC transporter substrate-binding protein n=1 Tax=Chachezhania sediminis TaxID=2599291 RepID=UPI00131E4B7E|nr:ABC transporter substrate-binding protein [Chachezhania sediminis]